VTIRAGHFEKTVSFDVTATSGSYQVPGANDARVALLVQSDRTIHIDRSGEDATVSASLRIPADTPVLVNAFAGDTITYVTGTGESDGTIWFTKVDH